MNDIYKAVIRSKTSYLVHYNPNHDKLGRFAKSSGSADGNYESGKKKKRMSLSDRFYDTVLKIDAKRYEKKNPSRIHTKESDRLNAKFEKVTDDYFHNKIDKEEYDRKTSELTSKIEDSLKNQPLSKDVIPVDIKQTTEIFGKAKITKDQHKCSAFDGDATAYKWENDSSIDVEGKSSTKTYKIETKSKNGVHLINSYKTDISFSDVGTSDGKAIDKHKLKELNDYSMSRESRKALDAGKKMASTQYLDTYKDWSSDPISRKLPDKYNNDNFYRDLYPQSINYKKNKKTKKPEIGVVYFVDKYDNFSGHVLGVYYEDGKPKTTMLEG